MSALSVIFYKGPEGVFGKLIRWWTRSPYSHCAICFNDIGEGEGRYLIVEAMNGVGIRQRKVADIDPTIWDRVDIPVSPASCARVFDWSQRELGCPYDWSGLIWSQVLHIPREHKDKWFCSEFAAAALQQLDMLMGEKPCTFSPGSLWRRIKG